MYRVKLKTDNWNHNNKLVHVVLSKYKISIIRSYKIFNSIIYIIEVDNKDIIFNLMHEMNETLKTDGVRIIYQKEILEDK